MSFPPLNISFKKLWKRHKFQKFNNDIKDDVNNYRCVKKGLRECGGDNGKTQKAFEKDFPSSLN